MRTPDEQLVDASLDMGKALLLAGGEVTRVEDTITRILHAYGMQEIGVFTITSLIEVTAITPAGDEIVKARRVTGGYATNLDKVERLNALSREICAQKPSPEEIQARTSAILHPRKEGAWISYVGAVLAASSFTVFLAGPCKTFPPPPCWLCLSTGWTAEGSIKKRISFCSTCSALLPQVLSPVFWSTSGLGSTWTRF